MKRDMLPSGAIARARSLRRVGTDAEARLRYALRKNFPVAKFRRQVPFGCYTADFASHGAKLIVEIDGAQHAEAVEYDAARTHFLEGEGYKVLRFWNNEVLENAAGVLAFIGSALPSPLVGCAGAARPANRSPVRETGRPAHGGPQGRMRGARRGRAPALRAGTPHPLPSPTRGEGESVKPPVWSL